MRAVAARALRKLGVQVLVADGGHSAIEIFRDRANEIDLVVLDVSMPDLGGRDVIREIRKIRPDVPVLTSSGHPRSEVERYFNADHPSGFLSKPYKPEDLAAAVSSLIENNASGERFEDAQLGRRSPSTERTFDIKRF